MPKKSSAKAKPIDLASQDDLTRFDKAKKKKRKKKSGGGNGQKQEGQQQKPQAENQDATKAPKTPENSPVSSSADATTTPKPTPLPSSPDSRKTSVSATKTTAASQKPSSHVSRMPLRLKSPTLPPNAPTASRKPSATTVNKRSF